MKKIGILGANEMASEHIKYIGQLFPEVQCSFFDVNLLNARNLIKQSGATLSKDIISLMEDSDTLLIAQSNKFVYETALNVIKNGKDLIFTHPFPFSSLELERMNKIAEEAGVLIQFGNSEKYNSLFVNNINRIKAPVFLDIVRLHQYSPSNKKIAVTHDLLLKDLEWSLGLIRSGIRKCSANAISMLGDEIDFINAKLEFDNGCIANYTASRIADINLRKARIYQEKAVFIFDFMNYELKQSTQNGNFLSFVEEPVTYSNEIENQWFNYKQTLQGKEKVLSAPSHLMHAMEVLEVITDKIRMKTNLFEA